MRTFKPIESDGRKQSVSGTAASSSFVSFPYPLQPIDPDFLLAAAREYYSFSGVSAVNSSNAHMQLLHERLAQYCWFCHEHTIATTNTAKELRVPWSAAVTGWSTASSIPQPFDNRDSFSELQDELEESSVFWRNEQYQRILFERWVLFGKKEEDGREEDENDSIDDDPQRNRRRKTICAKWEQRARELLGNLTEGAKAAVGYVVQNYLSASTENECFDGRTMTEESNGSSPPQRGTGKGSSSTPIADGVRLMQLPGLGLHVGSTQKNRRKSQSDASSSASPLGNSTRKTNGQSTRPSGDNRVVHFDAPHFSKLLGKDQSISSSTIPPWKCSEAVLHDGFLIQLWAYPVLARTFAESFKQATKVRFEENGMMSSSTCGIPIHAPFCTVISHHGLTFTAITLVPLRRGLSPALDTFSAKLSHQSPLSTRKGSMAGTPQVETSKTNQEDSTLTALDPNSGEVIREVSAFLFSPQEGRVTNTLAAPTTRVECGIDGRVYVLNVLCSFSEKLYGKMATADTRKAAKRVAQDLTAAYTRKEEKEPYLVRKLCKAANLPLRYLGAAFDECTSSEGARSVLLEEMCCRVARDLLVLMHVETATRDVTQISPPHHSDNEDDMHTPSPHSVVMVRDNLVPNANRLMATLRDDNAIWMNVIFPLVTERYGLKLKAKLSVGSIDSAHVIRNISAKLGLQIVDGQAVVSCMTLVRSPELLRSTSSNVATTSSAGNSGISCPPFLAEMPKSNIGASSSHSLLGRSRSGVSGSFTASASSTAFSGGGHNKMFDGLDSTDPSHKQSFGMSYWLRTSLRQILLACTMDAVDDEDKEQQDEVDIDDFVEQFTVLWKYLQRGEKSDKNKSAPRASKKQERNPNDLLMMFHIVCESILFIFRYNLSLMGTAPASPVIQRTFVALAMLFIKCVHAFSSILKQNESTSGSPQRGSYLLYPSQPNFFLGFQYLSAMHIGYNVIERTLQRFLLSPVKSVPASIRNPVRADLVQKLIVFSELLSPGGVRSTNAFFGKMRAQHAVVDAGLYQKALMDLEELCFSVQAVYNQSNEVTPSMKKFDKMQYLVAGELFRVCGQAQSSQRNNVQTLVQLGNMKGLADWLLPRMEKWAEDDYRVVLATVALYLDVARTFLYSRKMHDAEQTIEAGINFAKKHKAATIGLRNLLNIVNRRKEFSADEIMQKAISDFIKKHFLRKSRVPTVLLIQRVGRGSIVRQDTLRVQYARYTVTRVIDGYFDRFQLFRARSIDILQRSARGFQSRRQLFIRSVPVAMQVVGRGFMSNRKLQTWRHLFKRSCRVMRSVGCGYKVRKELCIQHQEHNYAKNAILAVVRGYRARKALTKFMACFTLFDAFKGYRARKWIGTLHAVVSVAARLMQRAARGFASRRRFASTHMVIRIRKRNRAAALLQRFGRGAVVRKLFDSRKVLFARSRATLLISRVARGYIQRKNMTTQNEHNVYMCCRLFQRTGRGILARMSMMTYRLRRAVVDIQSLGRVFRATQYMRRLRHRRKYAPIFAPLKALCRAGTVRRALHDQWIRFKAQQDGFKIISPFLWRLKSLVRYRKQQDRLWYRMRRQLQRVGRAYISRRSFYTKWRFDPRKEIKKNVCESTLMELTRLLDVVQVRRKHAKRLNQVQQHTLEAIEENAEEKKKRTEKASVSQASSFSSVAQNRVRAARVVARLRGDDARSTTKSPLLPPLSRTPPPIVTRDDEIENNSVDLTKRRRHSWVDALSPATTN